MEDLLFDIFIGIGIFAVFILPVIKLFLPTEKKLDNNKTSVNSKIEMLLDFATLISKHIQNNLNLNSPLILYEQIYFLYFLFDTVSVSRNKSNNYRNNNLTSLIKLLVLTHKLDYLENKNTFKIIFSKRYESYLYLLMKYKYCFTDEFWSDVFDFQVAQINSIKQKNVFTNYEPEINCINNTSDNERIKTFLYDNLELIKTFLIQC